MLAPAGVRAEAPEGDEPASEERSPDASPDDDELTAAEADAAQPAAQRSTWNEYDGRYFTLRLGGGVLVDGARYWQSAASEQQMMLERNEAIRDLRITAGGRFKFLPRLSYTASYMYDGADDTWRWRLTGLMFDVKELGGSLFIGRTKEGFSTNKIMVGYHGWTPERSAASDAFIPILADGVKWSGSLFDGVLVYNLGWFTDVLSDKEPFNRNDQQLVARAVVLPFARTSSSVLLHLTAQARRGLANDGELVFRSKPEVSPAQSFAVDTGPLPASHTTTVGFEAYGRAGPLLIGSEYYLNRVSSEQTGDPFFHGGDAFVAYLVTGETRPYNEKGAFFEAVTPRRSVPDGGPGALEVVLRVSHVDLDSGPVEGGRFSRVTPAVSWYVSSNLRLEAAYGYGWLDRMGLEGTTHFLQARVQLTLM